MSRGAQHAFVTRYADRPSHRYAIYLHGLAAPLIETFFERDLSDAASRAYSAARHHCRVQRRTLLRVEYMGEVV